MAPATLQLSDLCSDFAILKQLEEKAEFLMTPFLLKLVHQAGAYLRLARWPLRGERL